MADFFRNLWNGAPSLDNEFIGQILDVGNNKYRVKRLIAEGKPTVLFVRNVLRSYLSISLCFYKIYFL